MYTKAYINEHYYKGDTTMLDNLLLFMLGVCIGYTIIALTILIINAIKDSIYSLLVNIKHLWYNKWYNKKIEQLKKGDN